MHTILLAAGLSTRMGKQKLLLPFGDSTVVETVISNLKTAGLTPIHAVYSKEVAAALPERDELLDWRINEHPERGQSSSLEIGLDMLPDGADFCIMLGDLPLARPESMSALKNAFLSLDTDKSVLAPKLGSALGHPFFYSHEWKERFRGAKGDAGGKTVLMERIEELVTVEADSGHFKDIDTPDDYREMERRRNSG